MGFNDFYYLDMEKVAVNANEGDDFRWRVEIIDANGNKVNVPWVQLEYMVENITRYINKQISNSIEKGTS